VVGIESPLARLNQVDLEALASVPHVVISRDIPGQADDFDSRHAVVNRASWEDTGAFEAALTAHGLTRRVGVTVPDTYSALAIASRSDMATLIPRRLALLLSQSGKLKLIEPPYEVAVGGRDAAVPQGADRRARHRLDARHDPRHRRRPVAQSRPDPSNI